MDNIYSKAVFVFGSRSQCLMAMEELAELQQAISHKLRGRNHNMEEEIADVEIMLQQLRSMCDEDIIHEWHIKKLKRLDLLIRKEERI